MQPFFLFKGQKRYVSRDISIPVCAQGLEEGEISLAGELRRVSYWRVLKAMTHPSLLKITLLFTLLNFGLAWYLSSFLFSYFSFYGMGIFVLCLSCHWTLEAQLFDDISSDSHLEKDWPHLWDKKNILWVLPTFDTDETLDFTCLSWYLEWVKSFGGMYPSWDAINVFCIWGHKFEGEQRCNAMVWIFISTQNSMLKS